MKHAKSKCCGMGLGVLCINNNPEASMMGREMPQRSQFLPKR